MIPDNCECCPLEIGDGADCKRSRYDDEKQEVAPGSQCPFVLLAATEAEIERLNSDLADSQSANREFYAGFAAANAKTERLREAAREFLLLFVSGNSIPVDRVILKADHRIVNMFRAALAEGGDD